MDIFKIIILVMALPVMFYLIFPCLSTVTSLLAGKQEPKRPAENNKKQDFACIITAYKDTSLVIPLVNSLLQQSYDNYFIYLVADACDTLCVVDWPSDKVRILQPPVELASKSSSIRYAMNHFQRLHQAVVVLDPDNLAHPHFLKELNTYFNRGYMAVQGRRTAKNLHTRFAQLDAMGELYYNYTSRLVPAALGSSATIAGSGMAVATILYYEHLRSKAIAEPVNKVIAGEDKILQAQLVADGIRIAYAPEAILFDEKVASSKGFQRQRTRWINAYFTNLPQGWVLIGKGIRQLNFNQFYFGVLTIAPPIFLLITTALLLLPAVAWASLYWLAALGLSLFVFAAHFLLVLKLNRAPLKVWQSLWGIPVLVLNQFAALVRVRKANKNFLVTANTQTLTIEEVLGNQPMK
ncbi:MAG: glycosyltransferase [Bacteroidota bacterium]